MSRIVLASASPRRKELLEQIGLEFEICPAKGEEVITAGSVDGAVLELSRQKAEEVAAGILSYNEIHPELVTPQDILVIGVDTVVACDGNILGKPRDEADAAHMLSMLSGHTHSVYTGVTLVFIDKNGRTGKLHFMRKQMSACILWMTRKSGAILPAESRWIRREAMEFRDRQLLL